jgi:DNA-directed RNA polymerase specialized sigma24 family protein
MDTNHETSHLIRNPQEKRKQRFLRFKLQPGDESLLELMPARQRDLINASGSYQELAQRFGMPIGTVRSRLHRARAALEKLRDAHGEPHADPAPKIHQ